MRSKIKRMVDSLIELVEKRFGKVLDLVKLAKNDNRKKGNIPNKFDATRDTSLS